MKPPDAELWFAINWKTMLNPKSCGQFNSASNKPKGKSYYFLVSLICQVLIRRLRYCTDINIYTIWQTVLIFNFGRLYMLVSIKVIILVAEQRLHMFY